MLLAILCEMIGILCNQIIPCCDDNCCQAADLSSPNVCTEFWSVRANSLADSRRQFRNVSISDLGFVVSSTLDDCDRLSPNSTNRRLRPPGE